MFERDSLNVYRGLGCYDVSTGEQGLTAVERSSTFVKFRILVEKVSEF